MDTDFTARCIGIVAIIMAIANFVVALPRRPAPDGPLIDDWIDPDEENRDDPADDADD